MRQSFHGVFRIVLINVLFIAVSFIAVSFIAVSFIAVSSIAVSSVPAAVRYFLPYITAAIISAVLREALPSSRIPRSAKNFCCFPA